MVIDPGPVGGGGGGSTNTDSDSGDNGDTGSRGDVADDDTADWEDVGSSGSGSDTESDSSSTSESDTGSRGDVADDDTADWEDVGSGGSSSSESGGESSESGQDTDRSVGSSSDSVADSTSDTGSRGDVADDDTADWEDVGSSGPESGSTLDDGGADLQTNFGGGSGQTGGESEEATVGLESQQYEDNYVPNGNNGVGTDAAGLGAANRLDDVLAEQGIEDAAYTSVDGDVVARYEDDTGTTQYVPIDTDGGGVADRVAESALTESAANQVEERNPGFERGEDFTVNVEDGQTSVELTDAGRQQSAERDQDLRAAAVAATSGSGEMARGTDASEFAVFEDEISQVEAQVESENPDMEAGEDFNVGITESGEFTAEPTEDAIEDARREAERRQENTLDGAEVNGADDAGFEAVQQAPGQETVSQMPAINIDGETDSGPSGPIDRLLGASQDATELIQGGVVEPTAAASGAIVGIGVDGLTAQSDVLAGRDAEIDLSGDNQAGRTTEELIGGVGQGVTMLTVGAPQVAAAGYDVAAGGAQYTADELSEGDVVDPVVAGGEFAQDVVTEEVEYARENPARYTGQVLGGYAVGAPAARGAAAVAPSRLTGGRLSSATRTIVDPVATSVRAGRSGIRRFRNADSRGQLDASLSLRGSRESETPARITADDLDVEMGTVDPGPQSGSVGETSQAGGGATNPSEGIRSGGDIQERGYNPWDDGDTAGGQEAAQATGDVGTELAGRATTGPAVGAAAEPLGMLAAAQTAEVTADTATLPGLEEDTAVSSDIDSDAASMFDVAVREDAASRLEIGPDEQLDVTPEVRAFTGTTPFAGTGTDTGTSALTGTTTTTDTTTATTTPQLAPSPDPTPDPTPTPTPTPTPSPTPNLWPEFDAPGAGDDPMGGVGVEEEAAEIRTEFVNPLTGRRASSDSERSRPSALDYMDVG